MTIKSPEKSISRIEENKELSKHEKKDNTPKTSEELRHFIKNQEKSIQKDSTDINKRSGEDSKYIAKRSKELDLPDSQSGPIIAEVRKKQDAVTLEKERLTLDTQNKIAESAYLRGKMAENPKKYDGLDKRFESKDTGSERMRKDIEEFIGNRVQIGRKVETLEGKEFDKKSAEVIKAEVKKDIDRLLAAEFKHSWKKNESVTKEVNAYVDLLLEAQKDGDVPKNIDADTVFTLVQENVLMLAYQDRVASEVMLGDHGIRHLIDHNISVSETMLNSIPGMTAIDKLMAHQIMIMHDLGYATHPVKEGVLNNKFGIDVGHNLLSAKILNERGTDLNDPLARIFTRDQLHTIHQGILEHDESSVSIKPHPKTAEERRENLLSIIHLADNTHAFEDKLPELLYTSKDSLLIMRRLQTIGEIGDPSLMDGLKKELSASIDASGDYSPDDKLALKKAINSLTGDSFKFSIGRICGNDPEFSIDTKGYVNISVQESAIHQQVVGLFGQGSYDQLKKFIADITGIKKDEVDLNQAKIGGKDSPVTIEVQTIKTEEERKSTKLTGFQEQFRTILDDEELSEWSTADLLKSQMQKNHEGRRKDSLNAEKYLEFLNSKDMDKEEKLTKKDREAMDKLDKDYTENGNGKSIEEFLRDVITENPIADLEEDIRELKTSRQRAYDEHFNKSA